MIEVLQKSMSLLNMEQHHANIRDMFIDCSLKDYFDNYINHHYGNIVVAMQNKDFQFKAKTLMLYYEGAVFHNLATTEVKHLLLYGLYKLDNKTKKGQEPAVELLHRFHTALPEKRQLSEANMEIVYDLMLRDISRIRNDKATIIKDSASMTLYFDDDSSKQLVEFSIHDYMGDPDERFAAYPYIRSVDYIHDKLLIPVWMSRWAKMKAFNRNWPKLVAASRKHFKEQEYAH
jgi:hypothetical protein